MRIRDYAIPRLHRPLHPAMLPAEPQPLPVIQPPDQQLQPANLNTAQHPDDCYELEDRSKPSISSF